MPRPLWVLGSGSDFAVFVHHLGIPSLDFSLYGNEGGQYHTRNDSFLYLDRFLDPTWQGHESAARFVCALAREITNRGREGFDAAEAATQLAEIVRETGSETTPRGGKKSRGRPHRWLGAERSERIARELDGLAQWFRENEATDLSFYRALEEPEGLTNRAWYRSPFWAPSRESGYSAETLPELRRAASLSQELLEQKIDNLIARLRDYRQRLEVESHRPTQVDVP